MPGIIRRTITTALAVALAATGANALAHTITILPASSYDPDVSVMNTNLGLPAGLTFEEFEDLDFEPGLQITTTAGASTLETYQDDQWTWSWGADWSLLARGFATITFSFDDPVDIFGVGISGTFYDGTKVSVNDGESTALLLEGSTPWSTWNHGHNGYIKIEAGAGDTPIQSVTFDVSATPADSINYDHVAFRVAAIPEPPAALLAALGLTMLLVTRRR